MNKKPKCEIEECKNEALVLFNGRWICGSCFIRIKRNMENKFWRENENAS